MRPFGCLVTILNTLFDGKAKEGFLVGYFVTSKAFRVFNTQTKKVKENLHVNFLENKPNVAGQGLNWLFDIDSFANSMNYQPVTARNQANKNAGHQEVNGDTGLKKNVNVGHTKQEKVSTQQYIVFPLWSSISSSYKSSDDKARDNTADDAAGKEKVQEPVSKYDQALKNVLERMMNQEKEAIEQSDDVRKEFQAQFNTAIASRTFIPPHDPFMPELEDTAEIQTTGIFGNAYDENDLETNNHSYADESVSAEADLNNVEPSTVVSLIPTTRVHSNHPKAQIIGDPMSAIQIREKVYEVEKALYGLHQAPRAWYKTLSTYLLDNEFYMGQIDKTLFIKRLKGDILLVQMLDYRYNFMQIKIHVDNESVICVIKNLVYHSKTKHIEIRHHFIRDSYKKSLIEMVKIHTDNNVADLLTEAFDSELKLLNKKILWIVYSWFWTNICSQEWIQKYVSLDCKDRHLGKFKRGQDTKVPQSGGPLKKVGDEAVHKELGNRLERAATTTSSLEAEELVQVVVPGAKIPYWGCSAQTRQRGKSESDSYYLSD
uniref:Ribonuclease H-like domain-containing protein n=1 Tax=Tanacetum cinerariifolium TaxID=118510 RepID=A0A6L2JTF9_TANCI|nr:ribonuclease H-like domain-containing protein [Tanacetum cinerariifolium]